MQSACQKRLPFDHHMTFDFPSVKLARRQVRSAACSTAIKGSGVALIRHAVELQGARGMKLLFIAIHKGKMQHL